jgi:hypothetical protein
MMTVGNFVLDAVSGNGGQGVDTQQVYASLVVPTTCRQVGI